MTLTKVKQGGQSSSDIGRARGAVKLYYNLAAFGISWEKGMPSAASAHHFSTEWTPWFPVVRPKGREEGKNTRLPLPVPT